MKYCNCYSVLSIRRAIKDVVDETIEFISSPSMDEFSDICFGMNRLIGAITNKKYVRVFPFDNIHINKIHSRMNEYNCIRSKNHFKKH